MQKEEEFPHFIDEEDAEARGSEEEEGLHEHGSTSTNNESDGALPDADDDIRSQSTIGLSLEIVLET